jgi:hypothetical protein
MLETDPDLPPMAVASVEYIVAIHASNAVEDLCIRPPPEGSVGHERMRAKS